MVVPLPQLLQPLVGIEAQVSQAAASQLDFFLNRRLRSPWCFLPENRPLPSQPAAACSAPQEGAAPAHPPPIPVQPALRSLPQLGPLPHRPPSLPQLGPLPHRPPRPPSLPQLGPLPHRPAPAPLSQAPASHDGFSKLASIAFLRASTLRTKSSRGRLRGARTAPPSAPQEGPAAAAQPASIPQEGPPTPAPAPQPAPAAQPPSVPQLGPLPQSPPRPPSLPQLGPLPNRPPPIPPPQMPSLPQEGPATAVSQQLVSHPLPLPPSMRLSRSIPKLWLQRPAPRTKEPTNMFHFIEPHLPIR